jgi:iron(III) transport system substrate-binding protein
MIGRHTLGLLTSAVVAAALVSGCGGNDSSNDAATDTAATTADTLVVYSGRSETLVDPLIDRFAEESGINVEVRYGGSPELAAQLLEEGDNSPASVFFSQDAGALGALSQEGLFTELPSSTLELVPTQYRAEDGAWTGVTGRSRVLTYDSQQLTADQVPQSVFDLTDPQWAGQVAIAPTNASFQSFVTAMRLTAGDEATEQWLQGLVDNDVQTYEKNGLILDAVDTGQAQIGLINHYYWFEKAAGVGAENMRAQLSFSRPGDPGALVNVAGVGILASGNTAEAQQFVDYLLSDDAQTYFAQETFEYPLVSSVDAAEGLPAIGDLQGPPVLLEQLSELPATQEMLQRVGLI